MPFLWLESMLVGSFDNPRTSPRDSLSPMTREESSGFNLRECQ